MNPRVKALLLDAFASCRAVAEFIEGKNYDDYLSTRLLRRGVERELEIAGEALNHAAAEDDEITVLLPDLRAVVGLRNRLIHEYHVIDNRVIWDIANERVPELAEQLAVILNIDSNELHKGIDDATTD
ncbi:hypothetical protein BH23CHL4_BH23CHL4_24640 [soil metagenome]